MTFLEAVNSVLRRLREDEVTNYNETDYSKMVGDFINDAKSQIEKAWDWSQNRSIITVNAVASTSTYTLTGFGQEGKIISAWNDTTNEELFSRSQAYFDRQNYSGAGVEAAPKYYTFRGEDASDDSKVELYPTPDDSYSLKFNCVVPQAELAANATVIQVPWRPVVLLAVAMLAEEKGETGGISSARYFEMADIALSDSLAMDMQKQSYEHIWHTV